MALTAESLKPIYPKYDYKHTYHLRKACATYLSESNPFNRPPPLDETKNEPPFCSVQQLTADVVGRARGLFYRYTHGENAMCTRTADDCKTPDPVVCRGRTRTRCTQTRYRESSAQTHSYLPEVAGDKRTYEKLEIYQISKLMDNCLPPVEYEAKVVERARRRLQFERALKQVTHDKTRTQAILEAMEWQNWIAREEDIQGIQMLRMEIVQRLLKKREQKFIETSQKRMEIGASRIQAKQKAKLQQINVKYLRAMRQLEARRQNLVPSYHKGNIAEDHVDPASDLRAPQMRFGENPNRRHFVSFRKNFDDRINELDKRKDERGLSALVCPFSKLRTWAKPKERMKEVTQRFCSEENLKNLYESLKSLRVTAEAQKPAPKCLKKKPPKEAIPEVVNTRKYSHKALTDKSVPVETVEFTGVKDDSEQRDSLTESDLLNTLQHRRNEEVASKIKSEMISILTQYEGTVEGRLLKFLRDELERLHQMKKFQAIQMIAEKERWKREATEAGRRQRENKFRENNEVLYTAASSVRKDLTTIYLQSILEEEFDFTTESLAPEYITKLSKTIDKDDLLDKRSMLRAVISDSLNNQLFKVVKEKMKKMRSDLQLDADVTAITEELFMSVEDAISQKYPHRESVLLVGEVLDELIDDAVTYDFNLFTPDTSDDEFYPDGEIASIIDKLLMIVVPLPGDEEDFMDASEWQQHLDAKREAAAVIRKMVRRTVPAERWKHHSDRIVEQTLSDTFNAAVYEVECLKASRIVRADDRLHAAISEIYNRMHGSTAKSETVSSSPPSSGQLSIKNLMSIPSTFELFDHPGNKFSMRPESLHDFEDVSEQKINYVDPSEWIQVEPVELDCRHERYNILGKVAKRFRREEPSGPLSDDSTSSFSSRSTSSSLRSSNEQIASHSSSYVALDKLHPDFRKSSTGEMKQIFMSSSSYEMQWIDYEKSTWDF